MPVPPGLVAPRLWSAHLTLRPKSTAFPIVPPAEKVPIHSLSPVMVVLLPALLIQGLISGWSIDNETVVEDVRLTVTGYVYCLPAVQVMEGIFTVYSLPSITNVSSALLFMVVGMTSRSIFTAVVLRVLLTVCLILAAVFAVGTIVKVLITAVPWVAITVAPVELPSEIEVSAPVPVSADDFVIWKVMRERR